MICWHVEVPAHRFIGVSAGIASLWLEIELDPKRLRCYLCGQPHAQIPPCLLDAARAEQLTVWSLKPQDRHARAWSKQHSHEPLCRGVMLKVYDGDLGSQHGWLLYAWSVMLQSWKTCCYSLTGGHKHTKTHDTHWHFPGPRPGRAI